MKIAIRTKRRARQTNKPTDVRPTSPWMGGHANQEGWERSGALRETRQRGYETYRLAEGLIVCSEASFETHVFLRAWGHVFSAAGLFGAAVKALTWVDLLFELAKVPSRMQRSCLYSITAADDASILVRLRGTTKLRAARNRRQHCCSHTSVSLRGVIGVLVSP